MKKNKLTNKTTYLRSTSNYTVVSNEAARGKLSAGALGLLVLLLANQDTFIIHKTEIEKRSGFGETKFNEYWNELVDNGFIYSLKQSKGRISYHYVIVNDPTNKSNKSALKEILENHSLFSGDGESQMKNQEPNTKAEKKDTNISLNNKNISNVDVNNEDIDNVSLGINKNSNDIDELIEYWYNNINNIQLEEYELQIFEDTLFISTYNQLISTLKDDPTILNSINHHIPLSDLFKLFDDVKNNHLRQELPFTSYYLANELFEILQLD